MPLRYFDKLPDGQYQAKAVLRNMITFQRLNLIEAAWNVRKTFDAIFCRNVMIYFDRAMMHPPKPVVHLTKTVMVLC